MDRKYFQPDMAHHYANNIPFLNELEPELINSRLEIDLKALYNNLKYLKSLSPEKTKLMSVVKADAYGHGIIEIGLEVQKKQLADYLGVANVAEAKMLRQAGINLPILVMGVIFSHQLEISFKYNIETVITNTKNVIDAQTIGHNKNLKGKVHIKIDSGMGRVGVRPEKLDELLIELKKSNNLELVGVMTHFAESENMDFTFTNHQTKVFMECIEKIKSYGFKNFIIHSANSSATLIHPETYFDMTREGLAMYGVGDPPNNNLTPVLSLKSKIVNIKEIPKGNFLGYGRSFVTQRDSLIGIVPIGYADGFSRILSNKQDVLINGKRCPVVGNISMDQCLIDLTDYQDAKIGDEVILIGKSGNEEIKVEEWAKKSYKISYEVLCGFGNRLPRIYLE